MSKTMFFAYGVISTIAFILYGVCVVVDEEKRIWGRLLFVSVFACDRGYFLLYNTSYTGVSMGMPERDEKYGVQWEICWSNARKAAGNGSMNVRKCIACLRSL